MREVEEKVELETDVKALVKWFNPIKGFGFLQLQDGTPDAFLHISILEKSGQKILPEGSEVICDIAHAPKGPQVSRIIAVERFGDPAKRVPLDPSSPVIAGTVKFYNSSKGYGFVTPDGDGPDVFISIRILAQNGLDYIAQDQKVLITARPGQKGPIADSLEVVE